MVCIVLWIFYFFLFHLFIATCIRRSMDTCKANKQTILIYPLSLPSSLPPLLPILRLHNTIIPIFHPSIPLLSYHTSIHSPTPSTPKLNKQSNLIYKSAQSINHSFISSSAFCFLRYLQLNASFWYQLTLSSLPTTAMDTKAHAQALQSIPLKRFGTPEEVAHAALFLATNPYATNCVLNLDGGLSAT